MNRPARLRIAAIITIVIACLAANSWLVANPVRHVLLQLPLLGLAGWLATPRNFGRDWRWAEGGFAPMLLVLFLIAFWMLPRSIDGAVNEPRLMAAKFVILPIIGAALALGWRRAHPLLRGFVKSQAISMAGFMAFLFTHAPIRLCNNYLIDDQLKLGHGFLWLAISLSIIWSAPLFVARQEKHEPQPLPHHRFKNLKGVVT